MEPPMEPPDGLFIQLVLEYIGRKPNETDGAVDSESSVKETACKWEAAGVYAVDIPVPYCLHKRIISALTDAVMGTFAWPRRTKLQRSMTASGAPCMGRERARDTHQMCTHEVRTDAIIAHMFHNLSLNGGRHRNLRGADSHKTAAFDKALRRPLFGQRRSSYCVNSL